MSDKLTIVGPEPDDSEFKIPLDRVNIEALMLMAKYNSDFRLLLFSNREEALTESGIQFNQSEKMILKNISDEKLANNINQFYIPGIDEKSLVNWRKAASVILLVTSIMITGFNCSKDGFTRGAIANHGETRKNGWVDKDTIIITAVGLPKSTLSDIQERKDSAFDAAVLNAHYQTIEKFKGAKIEGTTGIVSDEWAEEGRKIRKELVRIIKSGTVRNVQWDNEQACEIDYQVKHKGLKVYIQQAWW